MTSKTKESKENRIQLFAVLFAVAFAALLASGCSTPEVSSNTVNTDTGDAYSNCRQAMSAYGQSTYQCDSVMSTTYGGSSYNQYAVPTTPVYSYYRKSLSQPTSRQLEQSYKDYLATLSPEALAEMNAQWNALTAQAH